jgi:Hint domain
VGGTTYLGGQIDAFSAAGSGTLQVTGLGSYVDADGGLVIGADDDGTGVLAVSFGAYVYTDDDVTLGDGQFSNGMLQLFNASFVSDGDNVLIGDEGYGLVQVEDAGTFDVGTAEVDIGDSNVIDSGGLLEFVSLAGSYGSGTTGLLDIGDGGTGTLLVEGGSQLTTQDDAIIGDADGHGYALITGANTVTVDMQPTITPSNWEIEGDLSIGGTTGGGGGVGTLNVTHGGTVFVDGNLVIWPQGVVTGDGTGLIEIGGDTDTGTGIMVDAATPGGGGMAGTPAGTLMGGGLVVPGITDDGVVEAANGQTLTLDGSIGGTGTLAITGRSELVLNGAVAPSVTVDFDDSSTAQVLDLAQPLAMQGTIAGFATGDVIDLSAVPFTGTTYSVAGDVLSVTHSGSVVASLTFDASYAGFALSKDGDGGTAISLGPQVVSTPTLIAPGELPSFPPGYQEPLLGPDGIYVSDPNAPVDSNYTLTLTDQTGLFYQIPLGDAAGTSHLVITGSLAQLQTDLQSLIYAPNGTPESDTLTLTLVRGDGVTVTTHVGYDLAASSPQIIDAEPTVALGQALPLDFVVSDPADAYIGSDQIAVTLDTNGNYQYSGNFDGYLLYEGEQSIIDGGAGAVYEPYGSLATLNQYLSNGNLLFVPTQTGTAYIDGSLVNDIVNGPRVNFSFPIKVVAGPGGGPTVDTWIGGSSPVLSSGSNWSGGVAPGTADTAIFAPIAGEPVIATTGDEIANTWSIDANTTFGGAIDANGASAAPNAAFDVNDNAAAVFLPDSSLFAARLVNSFLSGVGEIAMISGNQVTVGDSSPGTFVAAGNASAGVSQDSVALWTGTTVIANQPGAGGSRMNLSNTFWFSTKNVIVGNNAFGQLDLLQSGIDNYSGYSADGQEFGAYGQLDVGQNGALGLLVGMDAQINYQLEVGDYGIGPSGPGEAALAGGSVSAYLGGFTGLQVGDQGRMDLSDGVRISGNINNPITIGGGGVVAGDDWTIYLANFGYLTDYGTLEAAAGGASTIEDGRLAGNGLLLIDAGATLDLGVQVMQGPTVAFAPEFDGTGGFLDIAPYSAFGAIVYGFADGDRLETGIGQTINRVIGASYDPGSNTTNVTFSEGPSILFAGSLSAGNFLLDPNQPGGGQGTVFDYVQAVTNDQPPILSGPADLATTDNVATPIPGLSLSDQDAAVFAQMMTLTLTLTSGFGGTFGVIGNDGATVAGDGTGSLTVIGSLADVQGDLDAITFTPSPGANDVVTVTASDGVTTSPAALTIDTFANGPLGDESTGTRNYVYAGPAGPGGGGFDAPGAWTDETGNPYASGPGIADSATIDANSATGTEYVVGGFGLAGQLLTEGVVVLTGSLDLPGLPAIGIGMLPSGNTGPAFTGALDVASGDLILGGAAHPAIGGDVIVQGELDSLADDNWSIGGNVTIDGGNLQLGGLATISADDPSAGTLDIVSPADSARGVAQDGALTIVNGALRSTDAVIGAVASNATAVADLDAGNGAWTVQDLLTVGGAGPGVLNQNDGIVSAATIVVGADTGVVGEFAADSEVLARRIVVGDAGIGTMLVGSGGLSAPLITVGSAADPGELDIAAQAGGTGVVAIGNAGSLQVYGSAYVAGSNAGASGGTGLLSVSGDYSLSEALSDPAVISGGLTIYAGGTVQMLDGMMAAGDVAILPGGTLAGDGVVSSSSTAQPPSVPIIDDGVIQAAVDPADGASMLTLYGNVTGSGSLVVGAGATMQVEGSIADTLTLDFSGAGAQLILTRPDAFSATIDAIETGDSIRLAGIAPGIVNYSSVTGILTDTVGDTVYSFTLDPPPGTFSDSSDGHDGTTITYATACYARGPRIRTAAGEVAIEALVVGDHVVTASGRKRPVRWLGHSRIDTTVYPQPHLVHPIVVRAGAFADGIPARDLWLSPGHNVVRGQHLVPISALQNGRTIVQIARPVVEYWHLELDVHDIVLAEGLPAESYLDVGNRGVFTGGEAFFEAHPDMAPHHWADTCLNLVFDGPPVEVAKELLLRRADVLGHRIVADDDLHVVADGHRIEPLRLREWCSAFVLPEGCASITLRSRCFIPVHIEPASHDVRSLGVCVGRLQIDGADIALDDATLIATGWHHLEELADGRRRRWTTGVTPLPAGARLVMIDLVCRGYYWAGANVVSMIHAA